MQQEVKEMAQKGNEESNTAPETSLISNNTKAQT